MPVRSLRSPVLRWPTARETVEALRRWAARLARERPEVIRVGYFGSYARGDWGVGSDLDVLIVVEEAEEPFERRRARYLPDPLALPVPVDLWVYTEAEWARLKANASFPRTVEREIVWVYEAEAGDGGEG